MNVDAVSAPNVGSAIGNMCAESVRRQPDPGRVKKPPAGVDMGALYPALWGTSTAP